MSDFEILAPDEAVRVKLTPKYSKEPEDRFIKAVSLMLDGQVLFVPNVTVNNVSQYRHWMTKLAKRKLNTRTSERDGVKGLYMWAGPER